MRGAPADGHRAHPGMSMAARLELHAERKPNGCLEWTGARHDDMGYGRIGVPGTRQIKYVHVAAWVEIHGPVPTGMVLRHRCDNPPCMDVEHLLLGTQAENVADTYDRGRASLRTGEANNSSRLTWPQVRQIRADRARGIPVRSLIQAYGISKSQVNNILTHRQWKEDRTVITTIGHAEQTFGVTVHDHHDRDLDIPVLTALQHQGDVSVIPAGFTRDFTTPTSPVPQAGVPVVRGESGGNTHLLLASGPVLFDLRQPSPTDLTLGCLTVAEGATAWLAHPEHAFSGIGPGSYVLRRKREQADELRLIAD